MKDKIKDLPKRFIEFWNKYTAKQKVLIISILSVVIVALVILALVMSKTSYVVLSDFDTISETAEARTLLDENSITNKVSTDGLSISVDEKQLSEARLVLGENGIPSTGWSYSDAFSNSFSTTDSEKQKKYKLAYEQDLANDIKSYFNNVKSVAVKITMPETSTTIYESDKEAYASAIIKSTSDLSEENVLAIATHMATALGASNTNNMRVVVNGEVVFSGDTEGKNSLASTSDYQKKLSISISNDVRNLLLKTGLYDDAEVVPNLIINQDSISQTDTEYYTPDGKDVGPISEQYLYDSINGGTGASGNPGTDSNTDNTDYQLDTSNSDSNAETNISNTKYNTSVKVTNTEKGKGDYDRATSSIAVVLNQLVYYDESLIEAQGLLANTTWEQYKIDNDNKVAIEVDETAYQTIAAATGLSQDNITITAYQIPVFTDKIVEEKSYSNIISIILVILIVGLLLFIVFKGMKAPEIVEVEPELMIESILASTKENQSMVDIEFGDKSAARQQVEKFVDENPEAVAQLLRNWLNEDWD